MDTVTQPGLGDAANCFHEGEEQYSTPRLGVPAVVKLHVDEVASIPALTTFGVHMEYIEIVPRKSQMPQGTFQPSSSYMSHSSGKPLSN